MGKAGNKLPRKGDKGLAAQFITRNRAVRSLQITLSDFRQLCILKGIYPREPRHRIRAQKGDSSYKTLYYKKDITFLSHEPIIWKLREHKIYMRKLKRALEKGDFAAAERLRNQKPCYKLDHIVRERYPTFQDALRDMEDALNMSFLFAVLPKKPKVTHELIYICRRLTIEFMHYVIEANALRKAFISIKGYYYEVDIMGQVITWLVPHNFRPDVPPDVDLRVMTIFTEFYLTLLGFINFRLYHSLNINYPPKLIGFEEKDEEKEPQDEFSYAVVNSKVEALNKPLQKGFREDKNEDDEMLDEALLSSVTGGEMEEAKKREEQINRLKSLFKDCRFFLGRETNRESLTFVIRACQGAVSWDETSFPGATYAESNESITHQIVDRPVTNKKYLSRYYVQPQWVYDCINGRMILPIQEYFPGVELPPHLSPFVEVSDHAYEPPEKTRLLALMDGKEDPMPRREIVYKDSEKEAEEDEQEENLVIEGESDDDDNIDNEDSDIDDDDLENVNGKDEEVVTAEDENMDEDKELSEKEEEEEEDDTNPAIKKMAVMKGKPVRINQSKQQKKEEKEEIMFRTMMIPRKHKHIYRKLRNKQMKQERRNKMYTSKRKAIDDEKAEAQTKTTSNKK